MFDNHLPFNHLRPFTILPLGSCVLSLVSCFLYRCKGLSIIAEESLQIAPFFAKRTQTPKKSNERK